MSFKKIFEFCCFRQGSLLVQGVLDRHMRFFRTLKFQVHSRDIQDLALIICSIKIFGVTIGQILNWGIDENFKIIADVVAVPVAC